MAVASSFAQNGGCIKVCSYDGDLPKDIVCWSNRSPVSGHNMQK